MREKENTTHIINVKTKISTLWIVVMFNILCADVIGFLNPGDLQKILSGDLGITITQELLLVFSVMLEVPIAMIFLSRVLDGRINRWVNTIACVVTIVFVIGGGDTYLSYIFFASIEVMCMMQILWYTWKWS